MPIERIPDYNGAGVYALVDASGDMYIGSSMHCRHRITEHSSGNTSSRIRAALKSGVVFEAVILEEMPDATDDSLTQAEERHITAAGAKAAYNKQKTAVRSIKQRPPSDRPRSIAEYARAKGITTQAVYKRLAKAGIDPNSLREAKKGRQSGGDLSTEGLELLEKAMSGEASTINREPSTVNHQPSTRNVNPEVDALRSEVERLKSRLTEEKHRAELAEAREEAAANERDFLRIQLDNAIKASALASVKRLQAPEDPSEPPPDPQPVEVEEAPQEAQEPQQEAPAATPRSFRQRWRDAINAWKGKA